MFSVVIVHGLLLPRYNTSSLYPRCSTDKASGTVLRIGLGTRLTIWETKEGVMEE